MRLSFELFPPKTPEAMETLKKSLPRLAALKPTFFSVTYGAGGTTREGTLATSEMVMEHTGVPVATHLTYLTTPRAEVMAYADALWDKGVRHILALRGDLPPGRAFADFGGHEYFASTADFIKALKAAHTFEISVAAYPEVHPDAASPQEDIDTFRDKVEAGATQAITQFFFDNAAYWDLCAKAHAAGIIAPVIPGLLPVYDYAAMKRFADKCRARVPQDLEESLTRHGPATVLSQQIQSLVAHGADHIHVYTLNRAEVVEKALENF